MASVVAFVVTVELIALRGKVTDVARRACQRSAWENRNMLFPRQNVVIPAEQRLSFCLATQSIQPLQRTRQLRPLNAQPESAVQRLGCDGITPTGVN